MRLIPYRTRRGLPHLLACALVLAGCAAGRPAMDAAGRTERMAMKAAPAPAPAMAAAADLAASEARGASPPAEAQTPQARMVHHDGFIHLRAPRPEAVVDAATRLVEAAGGRVEALEGELAVFRVPVAGFQTVFEELLALGEVLDQSVTSEDITDAYVDVDLRLKVAQATHARLVELLAKAAGEKEKIRILREIQRVRIQIETLTAQRERLLSLAAFSRITLRVEARRLGAGAGEAEPVAAFEWIHRLSPFDDRVAASGRPLAFRVPEGMVALEQKGLWSAESADGAVLRASRHTRQPAGDTAFWLEAVRLRLAPGYAGTRVLEAGAFRVLRFEDRSANPYVYLVGLQATPAGGLDLVEVFFPTPEHEQRYRETVLASIGGGAR